MKLRSNHQIGQNTLLEKEKSLVKSNSSFPNGFPSCPASLPTRPWGGGGGGDINKQDLTIPWAEGVGVGTNNIQYLIIPLEGGGEKPICWNV